jgi:hypothetical protein
MNQYYTFPILSYSISIKMCGEPDNVKSFMEMSQKLIELFVLTYNIEPGLNGNTFNSIQSLFDFADYDQFPI